MKSIMKVPTGLFWLSIFVALMIALPITFPHAATPATFTTTVIDGGPFDECIVVARNHRPSDGFQLWCQ